MQRTHSGIIRHNMPVFYVVDALRALWFITSIWVAYEKQYLTLSQITFVEAILLTVTLLMQLPTGAFADLFGKRKAMITGFILYFCSMVAYAYANTLQLFLLYAVFAGMAEAFIDGTREALLYDTLKQDGEEQHFSVTASKLSMVFQISLAAATVLGGWIGLYSYVWTIRITAIMFLLSLANSLRFVNLKLIPKNSPYEIT